MYKFLLLSLILLFCEPSFANEACPNKDSLNSLFSKGGIYVGEAHGSNETPQFINCLVNIALENKLNKKIIVSLELPNKARNLESPFWQQVDGRASTAMWGLVKTLLDYENKGLINVHFQYGDGIKFKGQQELEEKLAQSIQAQLDLGFVIAYGGNFHSGLTNSKFLPNLKPAGMFLNNAVIHLAVASSNGGEVWTCYSEDCGKMKVPAIQKLQGSENTLVDGSAYYHDFLFVLKNYTNSPPRYVLE